MTTVLGPTPLASVTAGVGRFATARSLSLMVTSWVSSDRMVLGRDALAARGRAPAPSAGSIEVLGKQPGDDADQLTRRLRRGRHPALRGTVCGRPPSPRTEACLALGRRFRDASNL